MGEGETVTLDEGNASTIGSPVVPDRAPLVELGACIGRYTVRRLVGRGGMGEVYAAHDPSLDRLVAIKVMRPGSASHEARLRFLREAQVLARLNHPNVVAVHDVGTIADSTFLAMELVEGPTLADWLAEKPRPLNEVVDVFLAAGRGLAAAHAADITHRDFKPSNVMLGDARVRVVDFGLARPTGTVESTLPSTNARDATVTASGGTVGTPAYMAPEQAETKWSPLSDQYSFAIAFREAVTGAREGGTRPMPSWLRPLLERATALDPAARFPSMDALLAKITRGRHRRRRRVITTIAIGGAAAIITAIVWPAQVADPCPPADARFAGIWDAERRDAVHAAFTKTGLPYAEKAFAQVAASLDTFRERWLAAQTAACRATRVEGRQSANVLDLATSCLERQRVRVRELTQLWIDGTDKKMLERAHRAVNSLPASEQCEGETLPLPRDPALVASITSIRDKLDHAWALAGVGLVEEASKLMPGLIAEADQTGWIAVRAEAAYTAGYIANSTRSGDAERYLIAANQLALDAHADRIAAGAQVQLVSALSSSHPDRALLAADLAEATLQRAGNTAHAADRARLARFRGDAYESARKGPEAKAAYRTAYDLAVQAFGPASAEANVCLMRLSGAYNMVGEYHEARRIAEQSLAGITAALGEIHPGTAAVLNELGRASYAIGDYDSAIRYLDRALPIAEIVEGKESRGVATLSSTLGAMLLYHNELDRAEKLIERAISIREKLLGPDDPLVADAIGILTNVCQQRGDYKRQADLSRRALEIMTKAFGPEHEKVADALEGLALALNALGELEPALAHMRRVVELRKKIQGAHDKMTLSSVVQLGSMLGLRNRCPEAIPLMTGALTDFEQAGLDPSQPLEVQAECLLVLKQPKKALSPARASLAACLKTSEQNPECATKPWMIARILEALGQRKEAIESAKDAERRFAANVAAGVANQGQLDLVRAWLAKHK